MRIFVHRNQKKQKWFNKECYYERINFKRLRNIYCRDKTLENIHNLVFARSKYNKTKRKARATFKKRESLKINNLAKSNPRSFWKSIRNCTTKTVDSAYSLTTDHLYEHFREIFGEQSPSVNNRAHHTKNISDIFDNFLDA